MIHFGPIRGLAVVRITRYPAIFDSFAVSRIDTLVHTQLYACLRTFVGQDGLLPTRAFPVFEV